MDQGFSLAFENDTAFLQIVGDISGLPVALWSDKRLWVSRGAAPQHPCEADRTLRARLEGGCRPFRPTLFLEDGSAFWGLLRIGNYFIALGPATGVTPEKGYEQRYAAAHEMSRPCPLPYVPFGDMSRYLSLLSCHFFCTAIRYDEIEMLGAGSEHMHWEYEGTLEQYQLTQSEYEREHKSGSDFEDSMLTAVRAGDVEKVKQLLGGTTPDIGEAGQVAPGERKQTEYMTVSILTLLTRAAIEGGLHPEAAHELGDIYLNRLAASVESGGVFSTLGLRAMVEFAEQVHRARTERSHSSHVEACKAFVEQNLRKDIRVAEIAPALGVSRTYLSHLFQKAEGISLQLYIQREKCRHAERLLKFSDYPISLISEYFGFSSPSYFGTCFQRWYGITPAQYRRVNSRN